MIGGSGVQAGERMLRSDAGTGVLKLLWEKPICEGVWPYLDPWDSVSLHTVSMHRNVPGKYGPHGELFFFLLRKEPMVLGELIEFGPASQPKQ